MAAPTEAPCIALRGSEGIWMLDGPPKFSEHSSFKRDNFKHSNIIDFSPDGSLFAWKTAQGVAVVSCPDGREILRITRPRIVDVKFSPRNNLFATWEPFTLDKENPQGAPNLHFWNLRNGELIKVFTQKKQAGWEPQWSSDEFICCRNVNNELHFYENNNFETTTQKLHVQKVVDFSIPQNGVHVAVYVPGVKGSPSHVRLYKYPNFGGPAAAIANKSFYKADRVNMYWNSRGSAMLVLTATDTSADSYYGEQGLHFVDTSGESCLVPRAKDGPVYHVEWNPRSTEFCVVYGYMPAKATLFNLKCEAVFDFGTGPRNVAHYNKQGSLLCIAGFGNLAGKMEFWDIKDKRLVSKPTATDATFFQWCPDGVHFLTATTSPRLRVGNGIKVWHYSGQILFEWSSPLNTELWQAMWQPAPEGKYGEQAIVCKAVENAAPKADTQPARYVPPALRGKPQSSSVPRFREEYEKPSNEKQQEAAAAAQNLSKSALKNKKRKEAKQKAKLEAEQEQPAVGMRSSSAAASAPVSAGGDQDKEKKVRAIRKKLQAIDKLKVQQAEGKTLELNQLEKLKTEETLLKELKALELG